MQSSKRNVMIYNVITQNNFKYDEFFSLIKNDDLKKKNFFFFRHEKFLYKIIQL
jgi:hypothetical protein